MKYGTWTAAAAAYLSGATAAAHCALYEPGSRSSAFGNSRCCGTRAAGFLVDGNLELSDAAAAGLSWVTCFFDVLVLSVRKMVEMCFEVFANEGFCIVRVFLIYALFLDFCVDVKSKLQDLVKVKCQN